MMRWDSLLHMSSIWSIRLLCQSSQNIAIEDSVLTKSHTSIDQLRHWVGRIREERIASAVSAPAKLCSADDGIEIQFHHMHLMCTLSSILHIFPLSSWYIVVGNNSFNDFVPIQWSSQNNASSLFLRVSLSLATNTRKVLHHKTWKDKQPVHKGKHSNYEYEIK